MAYHSVQPITYVPQGFVDQLTHAVVTFDGTHVAYAFSERGAKKIAEAFNGKDEP